MIDKPVVSGNVYNKYESANPVTRLLMQNYLSTFDSLLAPENQVQTLLEIGCGEGYMTRHLANRYPTAAISAFDVSNHILKQATQQNKNAHFACASAYQLPFPNCRFDLIVCVEVLEHLTHFRHALYEIKRVSRKHILVSVPREPLWRVLNVARGAYLSAGGNTPGHVQHWSQAQFKDLLTEVFEVISIESPLPWTMALCRTLD
ncbi:MAG: class I SAM-dependent methyltransferase [Anaerolineae bacterium]|nr:class I SAM-dependent methyltransferase [Anaerolineae bacterium]